MAFSYSTGLSKVATEFNNMYKNNMHISIMPVYTRYYSDLMLPLRQALYYELYGDKDLDALQKGVELKVDNVTNHLVDTVNNALIGDTNQIFKLFKMSFIIKQIDKNSLYDLSDEFTNELQNDFKTLLKKLNVSQTNQAIYTINALFSNYLLDIDQDNSYNANELQDAKQYLIIQHWINQYITKPTKLQIPYTLGLIVTNGKDDQLYEYHYPTMHDTCWIARIRFYLSLIYQDANGWTPMNLIHQQVSNNLSLSDDAVQSYVFAYFMKHKNIHSGLITQDDIRDVFDFQSSYEKDLTLDPIVHLTLNQNYVVQAFYLDDSNVNNYRLFTVQCIKSKDIELDNHPDEMISIGSFDSTQQDILYHMPNYVPSRYIHIMDRAYTGSSEIEKMNAHLAAHTQTFAAVDKTTDEFLIGIYRGYDNSKNNWAKMFGLFNLDDNIDQYDDISTIHRLEGFGKDAYRLEASTDLKNNLLTIQIISKDKTVTYKQYWLDIILMSMRNNYVTNINDFKPFGVYTVPSGKNIIPSFQGFAYDNDTGQFYISSQLGPDKVNINQDQSIFLPKYNSQCAIYTMYWDDQELSSFYSILLTNFMGTSVANTINMQVQEPYKPISFATEIEGNLLVKNNAIYQMFAFHWTDNTMVEQPDINTLVKITWKKNA